MADELIMIGNFFKSILAPLVRTTQLLPVAADTDMNPDDGSHGPLFELGESRVRCVALKPTEGMVRGMKALDLGGPISIPVGPETLGRGRTGRGRAGLCPR